MMRKQRGVTMIGWIVLLIPVAVVLYAGIRVGPEYLNYYKVSQALKETAVKLKSDETLTATTIRAAIEKRFDTGYIDNPKPADIVITKEDKGWQMAADYETTQPMFGNLYVLMTFKTAVVIN
jgi:imidazolonepropionase-like amidohydrolase